ncbi:hypothetical protein OAJ80_00255 [Candidatus Thioglobus sp.]|nr:hypothetical protein [Candidatus Thioglobus sp.]
MNTNAIRKFEEDYFNKIIDIFHNKSEFSKNLIEVEDYIRNNYTYLDEVWGDKNKAKVAVERLIRYHIYKNLRPQNIYPSPLSPDMAIELDHVILCIDAKTIDMCGNPGDDDSIHFQKNQITFNNYPKYGQKVGGVDWPGIEFPPRLKDSYKGKPCLTFFITVNYEDDGSSFKISHVCFCSVPHMQIVEEDFNNDIITNFKTYEYIGSKEAQKMTKKGKLYKPYEKVNKIEWDDLEIEITSDKKKKNGEFQRKTETIYYDKKLSKYENTIRIRKKIDSSYKVLKFGGSARINKEKLKLRKSSEKGKQWLGVRHFKAGAGHESSFKTTGVYWNPSKSNKGKGTIQVTKRRHTEIQTYEQLGSKETN